MKIISAITLVLLLANIYVRAEESELSLQRYCDLVESGLNEELAERLRDQAQALLDQSNDGYEIQIEEYCDL